MSPNTVELQQLVTRLEMSSRHRVLDRFSGVRPSYGCVESGGVLRRAMFVSTETTGPNPLADRLFGLGYVLADLDVDSGTVARICGKFESLEDPGPAFADCLLHGTSITRDEIKGQQFDEGRVLADLAGADLVLAHGASFDRPFLEARFSGFAEKWFACSRQEVDWAQWGVLSSDLSCLAMHLTRTFSDDCRPLARAELQAHVLASGAPDKSGAILGSLLRASRTTSHRLWFEASDECHSRALHAAGFTLVDARRGGAGGFLWCTETRALDLALRWLAGLPGMAGQQVTVDALTGRQRYATRRYAQRSSLQLGSASAQPVASAS